MTSVFLILAACAPTTRPADRAGASATPTVESRPTAQQAKNGRLEKAGAVLDAALASQDVDLQSEALAALGASGRADALRRLPAALEAEDGKLRFGAARGLSYLRDGRAARAIAIAFRKERGWAVRAELARAAGTCGVSELAPDLERALKDPHRDLAVAAAFALADLGDRAGPAALARLGNPERKGAVKEGVDRWSRKVLGGRKEGDRTLAAMTLARAGTAEDADLLEPYLASSDGDLRTWAAAAVLKLGSLNH